MRCCNPWRTNNRTCNVAILLPLQAQSLERIPDVFEKDARFPIKAVEESV